jgi:hypothetical protein
MFGKFHKYNSRNKEYIQSTGVDDLLVIKNSNKELVLSSRQDFLKGRQDPKTLVLNGLIGWWRLDEGQGTFINDSSGGGSHGQITGSISWTDGYLGKTILSTNSGSNYVNVSPYVANFNQLSQASFSVSFWFRITAAANTQQTFLSLYESTTANKFLTVLRRDSTFLDGLYTDKLTFAFWANDDHSVSSILDNKWYHFVGTYDYNSSSGNGTRKMYINGVLETTTLSVSPLNFTPNTFNIANFSVTSGLAGSLNDMRIYNRALNANEVTLIYGLGSGDISKLISSNINTTGRNTSSLINKSISLVNNFGLVNTDGMNISAPQPTCADSLVGWWSLDEGNGVNSFDRAGKNYTATGNASITWTNDNYIGTAVSMATNRYLQTSNIISTTDLKISNSFTVCCWAKSATSTWNATGMLITNRVPGQNFMTFNIHPQQSSTKIRFYSCDFAGTGYFAESTSINDITSWNHYTGTYDGSNLKILINGIPGTSQTAMTSLRVVNAPINIGIDSGNTTRLLNGAITDCRIYNTALSQQEVMSIMQERRPLDTSRNINDNLIIWWPMNEGNGTVLQDYSGNMRTITLNGVSGLPTWTYTGPNNNRCLKYDSTRGQTANTVTTYSLTSNLGLTNKLTVSAWIKSTSSTWNATGAGVTHRAQASAGSEYGFLLSPFSGTSNIGFYTYTATGNVAQMAVPDITQWHHYVGTYNGSTVKIYTDGVNGASSLLTGTLTSGSYPIRVCADYAASTYRYLAAEVSDVRVYNTELTDIEVANLYQETVNNYAPLSGKPNVLTQITTAQQYTNTTLLLQLTGQSFANASYVPDYSGYQHHANIAVASAVTYSAVSTRVGPRSLLFNGTTGYLACDGAVNNGQPFNGVTGQASRTFSAWINPSSLAAARPILSYGIAQNRGLYDIFVDTSGNVNVNLDNSNASYIYKWDTRLTTGTWQHISLTQDNDGALTCYKGTSTVQPTVSNLVTVTNTLDSSNLQVWLPFKDGQGTVAYDFSGNTTLNNGTLVNAVFTSNASKFNSGTMSLNGTSAYMTTSYLPNLAAAFSWSLWVNPNRTGVEMPIIAVGDNDTVWEAREFVYEISSSNTVLIGQNGQFAVGSTGPTIQSNIWSHLGLAYNGSGTYSLYVNGALAQTRANTSVELNTASNTLTIGRYGTGASFTYFSGNISDFRAYNSNLNANAMASLYYNNWDRINTGMGSNNLQIGKGVPDSPYASNYYSGYMDDIRMYSGILSQDDVINIWSGGAGSYSQVSNTGINNTGVLLPMIPTQGVGLSTGAQTSVIITGSSAPLQAPAFLMASGFNSAFSNKTIIYSPSNATTYTYTTISTTGTWPPESFTGHKKVYFSNADDSQFDLIGSNALVNNFVYYGTAYNYLSMCTNGHFTIGVSNDIQYAESYPNHYNKRRISIFFNDLMVTASENPNGVYYGFKSENAPNDVCVVTYWGIADLSQTAIRSNCQVKLYLANSPYSGRIVMTYGSVQTTNALSGISNGITPTDASQGTNIAAFVGSIGAGSALTVIPDNIYSSNTIIYNYANGNKNNPYYYGMDSNTAPYNIRNGLVGWWKLDEPSGSIYYDVSGSGLNGTVQGSSLTVPRLIGPYNSTCINLEGNSYVSLINGNTFPVIGNNLTMSVWFNCSNISGNNTIMGLNTSGGADRLPIIITRQSNLVVLNGSTVITATSNIPLNSWNHVVVSATTGDPTANIRVYLNSQLFAISNTSNTFSATDKLFIGADLKTATFSDYFTGQIADARLYGRRLTDNDVKQLYNYSPGLTTRTQTGTYALDLFGSQTSTVLYSRRLEQTGTNNSNTVSLACWIDLLLPGTHTISSSKSTGDRVNGDWQWQLVSPGYDSLKGWWLLNEGTGATCYDLSPFAFNGTTSGTITWQDALKPVKAIVFNGTTSYVTLDSGTGTGLCNSIAGNKISVSAWFNTSILTVQQCIVGINTNDGNNSSFLLFLRSDGTIALLAGNLLVQTGISVVANSWQFICVTVIGRAYHVYYNSAIVSRAGLFTSSLQINSNDKAYIGQELDGIALSDYFNGMIADVRIWNRVLSGPEINDVFQQNQYLYASIKISDTTYPIYDTKPISLESWRHVGFQYTAIPPTISLYLDGQIAQISSLTSSATSGQPANLTSNIVIGALSNGGVLSQYTQGRISDFRQYNTLISDAEFTKLASGYYEQTFKLGFATPKPGDTSILTGLIDAGTKYSGSGGKSGTSAIVPMGEPRIQQTSNIGSQDGYELLLDGVNDYLDLSNSYIQRAYNRSYSITGWIKPDPISTIVSATTAPATNTQFGYEVLNNMLYTFGGFNGSSYISTIRRFDGNSWFTLATTVRTTMRDTACALFAGYIFIIGGNNGSLSYNYVDRFDGITRTTLNNFPLNIRGGCLIVYNNKLYHIGGLSYTTSETRINSIYVYDSVADSWALVATMNTVRSHMTAVVFNGLVYIIGGVNNSIDLRSVEVFNGSTCQYVTSLNAARSFHTSAVINGYIYNFGGKYSGARSSNTIDRFDGRTWTVLTQTLITGREMYGAGIINGKYYLTSGYRNAGATASGLTEYVKASGSIFSKATNDFSCYNLSYDFLSNAYVFDMGIGREKVFVSMTAQSNTYSHISVISSGIDGFLGMYLNGILEASTYLSSQYFKGLPNITTNIQPYIGKKSGDEASYFPGTVTDIRFWEKVLQPRDIQQCMFDYKLPGSIQISRDLSNRVLSTGKFGELSNGLIFWLSGEELIGTKIQDKSGAGVRAIVYGATQATGRLTGTKSMYFDSMSYITMRPSSFYSLKQSQLSVAFWVKFVNATVGVLSDYIFLLASINSANEYFEIVRPNSSIANSGELRATFLDGGEETTAQKITDTNWHHFVVTYNGGTSTGIRRTYLDGNLLSTGTGKTSLTFSSLPTICQIGSNGAEGLEGYLEDFRIYNRALSYDEVKYLYNTAYNTTYVTGIQQTNPGQLSTTYLSKYSLNNKSQVIDTPLPVIGRDNLICHYEFSELAKQSGSGLDGSGYVPDNNWHAKPLANYRSSTYLSNGVVSIPYNYGILNGNSNITTYGLYMDGTSTSTLTINPGFIFNDAADWTMGFYAQTTNTTANITLWSYTAASSTNNKSLFVNTSNSGEIVFKVGTATEYNTGCFIKDNESTHIALTKGTYGNQVNMMSFYKDGGLVSRQQISLSNDGTSNLTLGPFSGYIQDYRIYSTQLNQTQLQTLARPVSGYAYLSGPKHMWRFDEANTTISVIRDLGTEGTNLVLSNITIENRSIDIDQNRSNAAVSLGSIFFNGSNSFAQAFSPGVLRDSPRTITFWMKCSSNTNPGSAQHLIDYGDALSTWYPFTISRNTAAKVSVSVGPGTTSVISTKTINNTMWNHVGVVVLPPENSKFGGLYGTTRNILIYLNGENVTDTSTWSSATIQTYKTTSASNDWITLGKANNTASNYFAGFMDDVRMYDVALTPHELRGIYLNSSNYAKVSLL